MDRSILNYPSISIPTFFFSSSSIPNFFKNLFNPLFLLFFFFSSLTVSFSGVTSGSLSNSSHSTSKVAFVFSSTGVCIVLSFLKSPNSCFKMDFNYCFSSLIASFRAVFFSFLSSLNFRSDRFPYI